MRKIALIFLLIFLSSCAGTGSKTIPDTTFNDKNATTLYIYRTGGYVAGGVLAGIQVNGVEIAKIGTKEFVQHTVSGKFNIHVYGSGIGGFGMGGERISGAGKKGSKHYFFVEVDAGLITSSFSIYEVTESTFKQMR